ncbi:hypothetical protein LI328DRAFT_115383 [Trichoderma asperelloides]|nr:hypothetical protein LI328DRAFT_115383 [Trichoderma asperelloides]
MTVSFFNIGHACPVQRSYELLLRVEILLSHTFFFIYRLRIYLLFAWCPLLLDVSHPHTPVYLLLLFSSSLFSSSSFISLPLAARCVIA